jgi:phosphatidylinositol-3-phosphatase
MENRERTDVVGSASAPYQNAMLRHGRDYARYFAVAHPSLPNYLAVASGTTNGKTSDEISAGEITHRRTLWDQLTAAGVDWAVYEESMPSACYKPAAAGSAPGDYALKHNPAMPFASVAEDPKQCANVQPLSAMDPAKLPPFSFITPNECNDAHSCSLEIGDRWLAHIVPILVGHGADVIVTYDEGTTDAGLGGSSGGGHIFAAEVGHGVPAGSVVSQPFDHYSLLAGIEDRFGLRPLQQAARAAVMPT